ncbi:ABC transporter permease [Patulibacter sp.]|uniref:ABC transporter permease n=1 Tax=Patulibacter sp. TaxID=1912859 RepID=UPI0027251B4D|nr:ABC transporter permease [Patulibacter sp.]MDO9407458.1 ABC transporter permease [Patulibacter sp.]
MSTPTTSPAPAGPGGLAPKIAAEEEARVSAGRRFIDRLIRARELGLLVVLALIVIVTGVIEPNFLDADSLKQTVLNVAIIAVMTAGMTLVIVTRNIDLSVGSILGLSAFVCGDFLTKNPDVPWPVGVVIAVVIGAACGLLNGVLVTWGRVPALVVTLGTMYALRGVAFLVTDGRQINAEDLPDSFLTAGSGDLLGIPTLIVVALLVIALFWFVARDYAWGRQLYAIGSSGRSGGQAAKLAGLKSDRRVTQAFVISGALAGLGGAMFAARYGTVDATAGQGYELRVIGAAVVGGVAIAGGSGSVLGAALGAVVLGTIQTALIVLKIDDFWQQAIVGLLIIVAIALDRLIAKQSEALLRQRSARRRTAA